MLDLYNRPSTAIAQFGTSPGTQGVIGAAPVTAPGSPVIPANAMPSGNMRPMARPADLGAVGAGGGWFQQIGGLEGLGNIAQGLASLGSLYTAFQGVGLARDQFDFAKDAYRTNLANQTQSYNTALEDRVRSRYHMEGRDESAASEYLKKHSL